MTTQFESAHLDTQMVRFSRESYYKMAEIRVLPERHVELIDGRILSTPPQGYRHESAIGLAVKLLMKSLGDDYWIRSQMSLDLSPNSAPEPDVAVVAGSIESFTQKPRSALLIIEVSETSLQYDRLIKTRLYASNSIPEFWIVNLVDNCVEVFKDPIVDRSEHFTHRYGGVDAFRIGQTISPSSLPQLSIAVARLLPPSANATR